jgi:hypothetical protein
MSPVYARATDVVWRAAPDRVIVQRVDPALPEPAADLLGAAALVWTALDEPANTTELEERLIDAGVFIDWAVALERLVAAGVVITSAGGS